MYLHSTQTQLLAQVRAEEEEVTSQINTDKAVHIIAPKMQLNLLVQEHNLQVKLLHPLLTNKRAARANKQST